MALKLKADGTLEWQKRLGGSGDDLAVSAIQAADGGYVLAGRSSSDDGDASGNRGGGEAWVAKLGPDGELIWEKGFGGGGHDKAASATGAPDGGCVVLGYGVPSDCVSLDI